MMDLSETLNKHLEVEFDSPAFEEAFDATLLYVAHIEGIKVYHAALAKAVRFANLPVTPSKFRLEKVSLSSYIMQNVSYYMLFLCKSRPMNQDVAKTYKDFGVTKRDAKRVYIAIKKRKLRAIINAGDHARSVQLHDVSSSALKETRLELSLLSEELVPHIRYKVYKKLSFLLRPFNMEHADFASDLTEDMIRAYNRITPSTKTFLHKANYLRSTVNNRTLNIIEHLTSKKNERIVNVGTDNKDGASFIFKTESENQLSTDAEGNVVGFDAPSPESRREEEHRKVLALSFDRLIEKYNGTKRGYIIHLISGKDSPKFDAYLREVNVLRTDLKSHEDVLHTRGREEYISLVASFLDVEEGTVNKYLERLQKSL